MTLNEKQLGALAMATAEACGGLVVIVAAVESEDGPTIMGRIVCSHLDTAPMAEVLQAIGLLGGAQRIAAEECARGLNADDLLAASICLDAALPNIKQIRRHYIDPPPGGGS